MPWTAGAGRGLTRQSNPSVLPPLESQGLLTTKAPLWVTSSLLPILAAAPVNPPSLLVTNKRQAVKPASPFIWSACQQACLACLRSVAALLALQLCRERRGWLWSYCSAQKSWSCFWWPALPMLRWSNLLSAFWILAIAPAHPRRQRLQEDSYPLCICLA